jgi:hypothetical protein
MKQGFFNIKASVSKILQKTKDIDTFIEFITLYITKLFKGKNAKTFKNKYFLVFSNLIL